MSFRRSIFPRKIFEKDDLDSAFAAIGTAQAYQYRMVNPNIEDTLLSASIDAVNRRNGRMGGMLVDWITAFFEYINVERLTTIVTALGDEDFKWVKVFWCANAQRLEELDSRFKKLAALYRKGRRFDFIDRSIQTKEEASTDYLLLRHGEDVRFRNTCIRIPNQTFQHRPDHVFNAEEIARIHRGFKQRVIIGPNYRADMWAALIKDPSLSPYELAEKTYGSYATAHKVKKAYAVVKRDYSKRKDLGRS